MSRYLPSLAQPENQQLQHFWISEGSKHFLKSLVKVNCFIVGMKKERERERCRVWVWMWVREQERVGERGQKEREKERERLKIFPLKPLSSAKTPPDEKTAERKKASPRLGPIQLRLEKSRNIFRASSFPLELTTSSSFSKVSLQALDSHLNQFMTVTPSVKSCWACKEARELSGISGKSSYLVPYINWARAFEPKPMHL